MPVRSKYYQPASIAAFGTELLRNGGNASLAVKTIWPDDGLKQVQVGMLGGRLRKHPQIQEMLAEQERRGALALSDALSRYGATSDRAADELVRLAFTNLRDVVDWFTTTDPKTKVRRQVVRVRDAAEISEDAHRALSKISHKPDGTVTIELHDKQAAIMNLARLKGWIADKPEQPNQLVSLVIQR